MSGSKAIGNFIISDTKTGVIINDKNSQWKLQFSLGTSYHAAIQHYLRENSEEELNLLITTMFYATAFAVTDISLVKLIVDHYEGKVNKDLEPITKDSEEADLKVVKQNMELKDENEEAEE